MFSEMHADAHAAPSPIHHSPAARKMSGDYSTNREPWEDKDNWREAWLFGDPYKAETSYEEERS
jgi:hypothetical protein